MDIANDVAREGYGIVSYTWGYIAFLDHPQENTPEGLLWDVPTTKTFTLEEARTIMSNIGSRYVWWDWMCVPQNVRGGSKPITPELQQAKNQEISKQMFVVIFYFCVRSKILCQVGQSFPEVVNC